MKQTVPAMVLVTALASPAVADDAQGLTLMEEGARLFFRGLMEEMEPALEELEGLVQEMEPAMRSFMAEMGPALRDLMDEVEDWTLYHPPEILENGDIILRRRTPDTPPNPEIDL